MPDFSALFSRLGLTDLYLAVIAVNLVVVLACEVRLRRELRAARQYLDGLRREPSEADVLRLVQAGMAKAAEQDARPRLTFLSADSAADSEKAGRS